MAKFLGDTTAKYRWFAIAYMILMFVVLPVVTMGLSFAGPPFVIAFAAIVFLIFAVVISVNFVRQKKPEWLPEFLQDWKFLPLGTSLVKCTVLARLKGT
jgi:sodium-dependent phosphate cotransporter